MSSYDKEPMGSEKDRQGSEGLSEGDLNDFLESSPRAAKRAPENSCVMNSTYFGLLAEFGGEAHIPLERVARKYFGQSYPEARRNAAAKLLPCRTFRLGGQKSPWLVSAIDLADLIDKQRAKAD